MRIAFSTLGCPEASLDEVTALASEHGVEGLELRIHDEGIVNNAMSGNERQHVRSSIARAGLTVLSLGSYIKVCQPGPDDLVLKDLKNALELASDVGAQAVRVFPGAGTGDSSIADVRALEARGGERLAKAAEQAEELGLQLLLETHDSHPRGVDIARILAGAGELSSIGAIWDVMHPWRSGEDPADTMQALNGWFEYIQIKDAYMDEATGEARLSLPGAGNIPLLSMIRLAQAAPSGSSKPWVSLEWEKAWSPELPELNQALIAFRAVLSTSTRA